MMNCEPCNNCGVYVEIPIREAVGGKHIRGFPIAQMKGDRVRWRFVATEVNTEFRDDNHQGTPPLMIVRATISRAGKTITEETDATKIPKLVLAVQKSAEVESLQKNHLSIALSYFISFTLRISFTDDVALSPCLL